MPTWRSSTRRCRLPTGGGHQFLRALRGELERRGLEVEQNCISGGRRRAYSTRSTSTSARLRRLRATTCGWCTGSTGRSACTAASTTAPIERDRGYERRGRATRRWCSRDSAWRRTGDSGIELSQPRRRRQRPRSGDLPSHGCARAARRTSVAGRSPTSWSDNPRKGADVLRALGTRPRSRPVTSSPLWATLPTGLDGCSCVAPLALESSSPTGSEARTATSPRASTIPARTRCSRRSPAAFPPPLPAERRAS